MKKKFLALGLSAFVLAGLTACNDDGERTMPEKSTMPDTAPKGQDGKTGKNSMPHVDPGKSEDVPQSSIQDLKASDLSQDEKRLWDEAVQFVKAYGNPDGLGAGTDTLKDAGKEYKLNLSEDFRVTYGHTSDRVNINIQPDVGQNSFTFTTDQKHGELPKFGVYYDTSMGDKPLLYRVVDGDPKSAELKKAVNGLKAAIEAFPDEHTKFWLVTSRGMWGADPVIADGMAGFDEEEVRETPLDLPKGVELFMGGTSSGQPTWLVAKDTHEFGILRVTDGLPTLTAHAQIYGVAS